MSLIPESYKKEEAVRKAVKERSDKASRLSLRSEVEKNFGLSKDQLAELDPFVKYFNDRLYYAGGFYNILSVKFFKGYVLIQVSRTTYHSSNPPEILSSNEFYCVYDCKCLSVYGDEKLSFSEGDVVLSVKSGRWDWDDYRGLYKSQANELSAEDKRNGG